MKENIIAYLQRRGSRVTPLLGVQVRSCTSATPLCPNLISALFIFSSKRPWRKLKEKQKARAKAMLRKRLSQWKTKKRVARLGTNLS